MRFKGFHGVFEAINTNLKVCSEALQEVSGAYKGFQRVSGSNLGKWRFRRVSGIIEGFKAFNRISQRLQRCFQGFKRVFGALQQIEGGSRNIPVPSVMF